MQLPHIPRIQNKNEHIYTFTNGLFLHLSHLYFEHILKNTKKKKKQNQNSFTTNSP